jgi:hypothetical protein
METMKKTLDLDFFRTSGRRGGQSKSKKKIQAVRKNIRLAIAKRWQGRKELENE